MKLLYAALIGLVLPVAASAAEITAQLALARIAYTESPVNEYLDFGLRPGAYPSYFIKGKLPCQDHPLIA